jgi:hypothetical protein
MQGVIDRPSSMSIWPITTINWRWLKAPMKVPHGTIPPRVPIRNGIVSRFHFGLTHTNKQRVLREVRLMHQSNSVDFQARVY